MNEIEKWGPSKVSADNCTGAAETHRLESASRTRSLDSKPNAITEVNVVRSSNRVVGACHLQSSLQSEGSQLFLVRAWTHDSDESMEWLSILQEHGTLAMQEHSKKGNAGGEHETIKQEINAQLRRRMGYVS